MAQVQTLTLSSTESYVPTIIKGGEYTKWTNRAIGVLNEQPTAALAFSEVKYQRRVSGTVVLPILNAITGIVENSYFRFEFTPHKNHDAGTRERLHNLGRDFVNVAAVEAALIDGETPWG